VCRRLLAIAVALLLTGVGMRSADAWEEIRLDAAIDELTQVDRVDMGVVLNVVVADPNGTEYIKGKPKLRIVDTIRRGGMVEIEAKDGKRVARLTGASESPVHWYCSEDAAPLILHGDELPDNLLVYGSEGAGKTSAQVMWAYFRLLERLAQGYHGMIALAAPVAERLGRAKERIAETWSPRWYRWNERHQEYRFHCGITVKMRATKQQSDESGSPFQGYNLSDIGPDEIQDSLNCYEDMESRLRDAPYQRGKMFATATAKDSPDFRTWRDRQLAATVDGKPVWLKATLLASRSPFMTEAFIARKRATMTSREFQRRYEAIDLPPESQLYHTWQHREPSGALASLRPLPLGAVDITAQVLAVYGPNIQLLIGHDPGKRQHVSVFLKAYQFPEDVRRKDLRPRWFVVGEVTSEFATIHKHVSEGAGQGPR
jgi:hypothetical protein